MITKNNLNDFSFSEYIKKDTTKISDQIISSGTKIATLEGVWTCNEPSRVAIDTDGNVYPIAESIFNKCYVLCK